MGVGLDAVQIHGLEAVAHDRAKGLGHQALAKVGRRHLIADLGIAMWSDPAPQSSGAKEHAGIAPDQAHMMPSSVWRLRVIQVDAGCGIAQAAIGIATEEAHDLRILLPVVERLRITRQNLTQEHARSLQ